MVWGVSTDPSLNDALSFEISELVRGSYEFIYNCPQCQVAYHDTYLIVVINTSCEEINHSRDTHQKDLLVIYINGEKIHLKI